MMADTASCGGYVRLGSSYVEKKKLNVISNDEFQTYINNWCRIIHMRYRSREKCTDMSLDTTHGSYPQTLVGGVVGGRIFLQLAMLEWVKFHIKLGVDHAGG